MTLDAAVVQVGARSLRSRKSGGGRGWGEWGGVGGGEGSGSVASRIREALARRFGSFWRIAAHFECWVASITYWRVPAKHGPRYATTGREVLPVKPVSNRGSPGNSLLFLQHLPSHHRSPAASMTAWPMSPSPAFAP
jgi:hypothetical protein